MKRIDTMPTLPFLGSTHAGRRSGLTFTALASVLALAIVALAGVSTPSAFAQTTVAYWAHNANDLGDGTFGFKPESFPLKADVGTATMTIGKHLTEVGANGAYTYVQSFGGTTDNAIGEYPAGGSFSPQGGADNGNNGMYFDLNLDLTGQAGITVSWAQRGTSSGFDSRAISYSTDGGETFADFSTDEGKLTSTWAVKSYDFSAITAMDDNPSVVIRVTFTGATGATGNNRIDNILVQSASGGGGGGDDQITIRDLNTYPTPLTTASEAELRAHPLAGVEVSFTAVVVSNPRSSGNASYNTGTNSIGRLHLFVTDTTALNDPEGRSGMSIQIVETNLDYVENLVRGGIYTFTGVQTFYFSTVQFDLTAAPVEVGNVNSDYPEYASLLEPWVITLDELNTNNGDGTFQINVPNYSKYNGAYVKVEGATVILQEVGSRPNWAVDKESRAWIYDISLRYRNDRMDSYRSGYNYRRSIANGGKGEFTPPPSGATVDLSGFIQLDNDNPGGDNAAGAQTFSINPFEDGTFWSQDGTRFDDGQDLGGGFTFEWPNDVVVLSAPPLIANVALTPDKAVFATSDAITLSADVTSQVDGTTITKVEVTYTVAGSEAVTAEMTKGSGDTYSFTFPSIADRKSVSYSITATASDASTGAYPIVGAESFIVSDSGISSIELIQRTGDGKTGPSPLAGSTGLDLNIIGTIVSDATDGVIVLHDAAAPWSGIFLERTSATTALVKGDVIAITKGNVVETAPTGAGTSATFTQLTGLTFSKQSTGADVDAMIPSVLSDDVRATLDRSEFEPYEGMLIRFEDAVFLAELSFGEFSIANKAEGASEYPTTGVIFNEDIRASAIGEMNFSIDVAQQLKDGATFESITGVVVASFGAPKIIPRGFYDLVGDDWSFPRLTFALVSPIDGAEVEVTGDVTVEWEPTSDFDGDSLTYDWRLYTSDGSRTLLASVPADNSGKDAKVTLPFSAVDGLLASAGVEVGQTASLLWNVQVNDSNGSFVTAERYSFTLQAYDTLYFAVNLKRGNATSVEVDGQLPAVYKLGQNFPNPFNPSTSIRFDLPKASQVRLTVYNMLGQRVATLADGMWQAGTHQVAFDASSLASGAYIYRLEAGAFMQSRQMLLVK